MRGPFVVRSIVAVLTAWALLMIVPDVTRPFAPLGTIGITADFDGHVVAVAKDGPAAAADVRAKTPTADGDRIDLTRTPADTLFALYGGLGGRPFFPPGTSATLVLVAPDRAARAVTLVAAERRPPVEERVSLFLAEFFGIGFIALGAFLAWNFPGRRDVFGFFLYAIWFNPGENYVFYSLLPRPARIPQELLSALLQATGIAGFAMFALRFPTDRSEGWRRPMERALPLLVGLLTALAIAGEGAEFGRPSRTLWLLTFWVKVAIYPLIVAAFLTKLQLLAPVERQRVRLVILGCIPGLFFFLLAESAEATSLWQPLFDRLQWSPPEALLDGAYLVNALVPISIGYAVLRKRVLPIDFFVNRGLTLGIVWVIVAMSVEATVLTTHSFLEENHVLSTLLLAAALVAAAPVLERLKAIVNDWVDRVLFGRLRRAARELDGVARGLATATSRLEIEAAIVDAPCTSLDLAAAALFVLDDDGSYHVTAQRGWPANALQAFSADDALLRKLPLTTGAMSAGPVGERSDFPPGAARPALIVTLAPHRYIEAVVLFGGHADGSALTTDESSLLVRFVRECGAARAHVAAVAMRREIAQLRRTSGAGAERLTAQSTSGAAAEPA